jgi:hypothetical protein
MRGLEKDIASTLVARITDVQEKSLIATLTEEYRDEFPLIHHGREKLQVGQVGSYVKVVQGDIQVIGMIIRATAGEGDAHGQMHLIPVGEFSKDNVFYRGISCYPTPGADVHVMTSSDVGRMFERFRAAGFELGHLPTSTSMRVYLDPTALFSHHLAILGQSGSGKSWGVTALIQRVLTIMPKAHIIVLDLHGEYCWTDKAGKKHVAFPEDKVRAVDARDLEIPYWLLTYGELVDLLIDRSDERATIQMAFLRDVLSSLRKESNPEMDPEEITIDSPLYFSLETLVDHFKLANEQTTQFGKVKGPLYGQFNDLLVKLQSRINDSRYSFLFHPRKRNSSASLSGLLREFVGLTPSNPRVTVIDFSSVPFDVRPTVSAQIGRLAFEFNYWNPQSSEFPLLLVCEEAHAYIPREGGTQFEGTRRSMERIAKEGRKYGVGLAVVSQRPHELSETVLAQCGSFFCFRVTNPDDQQYIRDLVPDSEGDLVDILSSLGRGEVVALGDASPVLTRFQMRPPSPTPNSDDIDFFTQWREGPDDLNVEAIAKLWQRQGRT